ncbi:MAG: hypothetical protein KAY03_05560 [Arenimonas sp.]|nr:hypothetical protein [Arenimonas sp.]
MFEKFSRSWSLVKASAEVLRADKELLLFPILSGIAALLVVATFVVPMFALRLFEGGVGVAGTIWGFLFYLCLYFITFFFNAALVSAAIMRLEGGNPTVMDGFNAARERIVPILGYAAIAATVGMLLQALKNKENNFLVRIIGSGLGVAWTLSTFLVVPVLVQRNVGPIDAIRQSVELLKSTWGENAIGNVGLGAVFGLIMFGAIALGMLLVIAASSISGALAVTIGVLAVIAVIALGMVQSALSGIYSAALYRYATAGEAPAAFGSSGLQNAFAPK